jgi:hypothetical protein
MKMFTQLTQAKSRRLLAGFTVLLLAMIFTLTGCPADADENPPSDPSKVEGADIYLLDLTTKYSGTGTAQDVTGKVASSNDIGKIGTISKEGKLTLSLPATVDDSKLSSMGDFKAGSLTISPSLELKKSGTDIITLMYINKDVSDEGVSVKKGWNYMLSTNLPTTDISGYKWVITTGQ